VISEGRGQKMDRRSQPDQGTPRKATTTKEAARVWQRLGDFKPCWSDVPFPNYVYDQQQARAVALGDLALLDAYLRQNGRTLSQLRGTLEFGCGLTRGSDWLAHHGGMEANSRSRILAALVAYPRTTEAMHADQCAFGSFNQKLE
jgi:hypothetical protein